MNIYNKTVTLLTVRPNDLDSVGHVNNACALEYFEHGRWDWLCKNGLSRKNKIIPVVVRIEVDYGVEIPWSDIRIETNLLEGDDLVYKAIFKQSIYVDSSNEVAVKAVVHVAFIDAYDRAVCAIQDYIEQT
jgi:acyl-CoA thioester hydrolase